MFGNLNAAVFLALWILVPLLTADCINREKREGTLGLLFLTPLTSTGIVAGKSVVHLLRALTLYFAMLPVIVMPVMLGGVTVQDALMAALLDLGVLLLALAAGLLASAWTRDWLKSVAVAELLAALFVFLFMAAHRGTLAGAAATAMPPPARAGAPPPFNRSGMMWVTTGYHSGHDGFLSRTRQLFAFATNLAVDDASYVFNATTGRMIYRPVTGWSEIWSGLPGSVHATWFRWTGGLVLGCLGVLIFSAIVAGKSIERAWRDLPTTARRQQVNDVFTQPVVGRSLLRRRLKRALERNPIGWLQQYSWHARLTKWGWCSFVVFMELLFASNWQDAWNAQGWVALLVLLGLTFSAAGSFRSERESGALELLLVTPLRAGQVIRGRLQGIRMQYLPSMLTLALAWFCLLPPRWPRVLFMPENWDGGMAAWLCLLAAVTVSFVTLPVIGLYFSLKRMNHLVSWLCACGVGALIPWLLFRHLDFIFGTAWQLGVRLDLSPTLIHGPLFGLTAALLWQAAAATVAAVLLYANLARRRFIAK